MLLCCLVMNIHFCLICNSSFSSCAAAAGVEEVQASFSSSFSFVLPPTEDYRYWQTRGAEQRRLFKNGDSSEAPSHGGKNKQRAYYYYFFLFCLHGPFYCFCLWPPFLFLQPLFLIHGSTVSPTVCFEAFHPLLSELAVCFMPERNKFNL